MKLLASLSSILLLGTTFALGDDLEGSLRRGGEERDLKKVKKLKIKKEDGRDFCSDAAFELKEDFRQLAMMMEDWKQNVEDPIERIARQDVSVRYLMDEFTRPNNKYLDFTWGCGPLVNRGDCGCQLQCNEAYNPVQCYRRCTQCSLCKRQTDAAQLVKDTVVLAASSQEGRRQLSEVQAEDHHRQLSHSQEVPTTCLSLYTAVLQKTVDIKIKMAEFMERGQYSNRWYFNFFVSEDVSQLDPISTIESLGLYTVGSVASTLSTPTFYQQTGYGFNRINEITGGYLGFSCGRGSSLQDVPLLEQSEIDLINIIGIGSIFDSILEYSGNVTEPCIIEY